MKNLINAIKEILFIIYYVIVSCFLAVTTMAAFFVLAVLKLSERIFSKPEQDATN